MTFATIDWGDGSITTVGSPAAPIDQREDYDYPIVSLLGASACQHVYAQGGSYTIQLTIYYPVGIAPNLGTYPIGILYLNSFDVVAAGGIALALSMSAGAGAAGYDFNNP